MGKCEIINAIEKTSLTTRSFFLRTSRSDTICNEELYRFIFIISSKIKPACKIRNSIIGCILFLFFLSGIPGNAQTYPVHLTTKLIAPFSGYLPDYANAGEEKLKVLILFTDFTKLNYTIKLKISIQGQGISIQSKSYYYEGPFTVQPGVPIEISGNELYGLLNSQNLDFNGINKTQYEQRKVLPEGFYTFCITAYDYNNPVPIQVSNTSCTQAWMVLSDPPFLNLPVCSSTVTPLNPQQQTFSFTQMNMGSPNSAANTEYVFELWEVRPQGAIANNIVQTVPPIFTYTTNLTSINYSITEPPLLLGMQYAWRVHAVDITGRDLFKNQGYSQVCTFTYGSIFDGSNLNLNLHAQGVSHRQVKVWWDSLSTFTGYNLEFRKAGSGGNWYPLTTTNSSARILDLEPQTTYEFHVQGVSAEYTSPFSSSVKATTLSLPNYQCGETYPVPGTAQFIPLTAAHTNMIWQVGQFEMKITQLKDPINNPGMYTGLGKITMPYGLTVNCSFTNILVNSDRIVVQGKVVAL
ncbi:MAG TPA: fibronectin type III domain-containing protein, partial [Bacteroidia bacterium]|nr:fibronectin type III domain-containing protein [Bacteroidia bacterium]